MLFKIVDRRPRKIGDEQKAEFHTYLATGENADEIASRFPWPVSVSEITGSDAASEALRMAPAQAPKYFEEGRVVEYSVAIRLRSVLLPHSGERENL